MDKPATLFDRDSEWAALSAFAQDPRPGATLAVVRGRRRHGKSVLLRSLCAQVAGFYYQAIEGTQREQLDDLAQALAQDQGMFAPPSFDGWQQAIAALLSLPAAQPRLVVLDEFPYLLASAPGLTSILQRALDERKGSGPAVRLAVCGSALTVMTRLLAGPAPLRGRASVEVPVRAFSFRDEAEFLGLRSSPGLALKVNAICGGVPGYASDLLGGDLPANDRDFAAWMRRGPLNHTRPLVHEARHLLDEPGVRDRAFYWSVLTAIADGATTSGRIAGLLQRPAAAIAHPLRMLEEMGLVRRRQDLLRKQRPTWSIADPLLRFYVAILRRDWARIEQGRTAELWKDAQGTWTSQVLGPHFEEAARTWVAAYAAPTTIGGTPSAVGTTVLDDRAQRSAHEIDVVAADAAGQVLALGEAKLSRRMGRPDLERLQRARALLVQQERATDEAPLLLFGGGGFTKELLGEARAGRVGLVDLERLYAGD